MISEKLVNKVLGIHINNVQIHNLHNKENELNINGVQYNIHELAHKCKEWANNINITIDSGYDGDICEATVFINETRGEKFFHAPTEPEAVFKACEWILEQNDNTQVPQPN